MSALETMKTLVIFKLQIQMDVPNEQFWTIKVISTCTCQRKEKEIEERGREDFLLQMDV